MRGHERGRTGTACFPEVLLLSVYGDKNLIVGAEESMMEIVWFING